MSGRLEAKKQKWVHMVHEELKKDCDDIPPRATTTSGRWLPTSLGWGLVVSLVNCEPARERDWGMRRRGVTISNWRQSRREACHLLDVCSVGGRRQDDDGPENRQNGNSGRRPQRQWARRCSGRSAEMALTIRRLRVIQGYSPTPCSYPRKAYVYPTLVVVISS